MFLTIQIQSILALGMNTANTTGMRNTVPVGTESTMDMGRPIVRKNIAPAGTESTMNMGRLMVRKSTAPAGTDITMNMEKTTVKKITAPVGMGTNMGMILGIRGNILMQMLQPGLNSPA